MPAQRNCRWQDLYGPVFECTGVFREEPQLAAHLAAGARYVLLSAPARSETVATVVHGTEPGRHRPADFSCASCTTNCVTPVMEILARRIGVTGR